MVPATLRDWGNRIGEVALVALCLSAFLAPAASAAALALLVVGFVLAPPGGHALEHPVVRAAAVFAVFVVLHTIVWSLREPAAGADLWKAAGDWLQLMIFIPFAYVLARDPGRIGRLLALTLAGLIGGMLLRVDWDLLLAAPDALYASRPGFGFPPIAYALYGGSAILGLVFLARRWWSSARSRTTAIAAGLLWLACLLLLTEGLLASQSRGSWLAFAVALALGVWIARRLAPAVRPADGRRGVLLSLAAVAAIAALLALNLERIVTRLTTEQETVGAMWRGDRSGPPTTSLGLRWQAQAFGLARWLERPFLGWGAGTSSRLIEQSEDPGLREEGQALRHLHNAYLELLVQFGVAGTALAGVFLARLVGGLWRAARARRCPADYGAFLLAAFAFMLIWSLWSYRAGHQDWRVYWVLLAGTSLGFLVSPARAPREAPQPSAADGRGPSSPAARGTDP